MLFFSKKFPFIKKVKYHVSGEGNRCPTPSEIRETHRKSSLIVCGKHNEIVFGKNVTGKLMIEIYGNGCRLELGENVMGGGHIAIGSPDCPAQNVAIRIGAGTTFSGPCTLRAMDDESKIIIGEDVMFSGGIQVWASDTHALLNESGTLMNRGGEIIIGAHSWIGMDVKIGKNVKIGEGSVIGWNSVVCGNPEGYPPRSLLAGSPASVRKSDVRWSRRPPNFYSRIEEPLINSER